MAQVLSNRLQPSPPLTLLCIPLHAKHSLVFAGRMSHDGLDAALVTASIASGLACGSGFKL